MLARCGWLTLCMLPDTLKRQRVTPPISIALSPLQRTIVATAHLPATSPTTHRGAGWRCSSCRASLPQSPGTRSAGWACSTIHSRYGQAGVAPKAATAQTESSRPSLIPGNRAAPLVAAQRCSLQQQADRKPDPAWPPHLLSNATSRKRHRE